MEEIRLSPLEEETGNPADAGCTDVGSTNTLGIPSSYPMLKWPWKYIRHSLSILALAAILGCFGTSVTLIAHLPQTCDVPTEWWQGKIFYEIFPASFCDSDGDGSGDLNGIISKVDYLRNDLHVDVVRLNSIFRAHEYPARFADIANATEIDPRLGNLAELRSLLALLERRNMSLVMDVHIDRLPGIDQDHISADSHQIVQDVLIYWIGLGVHGFHLKGLDRFAHQGDLWEYAAKWKTAADNLSSGLKQRRIFVVSSSFLTLYSSSDPRNSAAMRNQFDLVEHFVRIDRLDTLSEQIKDGVCWDNSAGSPWILWSLGGVNRTRLADVVHWRGRRVTVGPLMFLASLPGSVSIFYGDEIGLSGTSYMRWNAAGFDDCVPTVGRLNEMRTHALPLYVNAVVKYDSNDHLQSRSHNYICRVLANSTVVVERFYPRRHRYLVVSNLGPRNVTHDLSNTYFGGQALVSSTGSKRGYIRLQQLHMQPGEAVVLLLDK